MQEIDNRIEKAQILPNSTTDDIEATLNGHITVRTILFHIKAHLHFSLIENSQSSFRNNKSLPQDTFSWRQHFAVKKRNDNKSRLVNDWRSTYQCHKVFQRFRVLFLNN